MIFPVKKKKKKQQTVILVVRGKIETDIVFEGERFDIFIV